MLDLSESRHRNTNITAGRGLLFNSFPFLTPFSPRTAVLFPTVLKISRFVLNVKNDVGFSLGTDYSTFKLISLSRSFALSYFHTTNFSVVA